MSFLGASTTVAGKLAGASASSGNTNYLVLALPAAYPYVALGAISSVFLTLWQSFRVGTARKASGLKYPNMYFSKDEAEKDKKAAVMNCTQRAVSCSISSSRHDPLSADRLPLPLPPLKRGQHQNTLEVLPQFLLLTLLSGLRFPRASAVLAGVWVASRVVYTVGYSTGDPRAREAGAIPGFLAYFSLAVAAVTSVVQLGSQVQWQF